MKEGRQDIWDILWQFMPILIFKLTFIKKSNGKLWKIAFFVCYEMKTVIIFFIFFWLSFPSLWGRISVAAFFKFCQFLAIIVIFHNFFFIKTNSDIKMGICFLEKKCHRISEISFLPSLKAKLLFTLCVRAPSM